MLWLFQPILVAETSRGDAFCLAKSSRELPGILESEYICQLGNAMLFGYKQLFGAIHNQSVAVLHGCNPRDVF